MEKLKLNVLHFRVKPSFDVLQLITKVQIIND
jgi:hypothetical protein